MTFVLVHDQHGHGEASQTGCSGVLPTSADDAAHGGYIAGGINASYTDLGGAGGTPPLTTDAPARGAAAPPARRVRAGGVPASSSAGVAAPETDPLGGRQAANQIDPGDWLALNNRYSFDDMDKQITFRFANNRRPARCAAWWTSGSTRSTARASPRASCGRRGTTASTRTRLPVHRAVTGSHRIYLTFRQAPGRPGHRVRPAELGRVQRPGV